MYAFVDVGSFIFESVPVSGYTQRARLQVQGWLGGYSPLPSGIRVLIQQSDQTFPFQTVGGGGNPLS